MATYGQFCPLAKATEVVAERWTPLILREIMLGSRRFNELQRGLPNMSRTLLSQRLRELSRNGVVERRPSAKRGHEYHLTSAGRELEPIIVSLSEWGQRWLNSELRPTDINPDLLVWDVHRSLFREALPPGRTVVQLELLGLKAKTYWLVIESGEASVCWTDPGYEVDLLVTADTVVLHKVWLGLLPFAQAMRSGDLCLAGSASLVDAFPSWLKLSSVAHIQPVAR